MTVRELIQQLLETGDIDKEVNVAIIFDGEPDLVIESHPISDLTADNNILVNVPYQQPKYVQKPVNWRDDAWTQYDRQQSHRRK